MLENEIAFQKKWCRCLRVKGYHTYKLQFKVSLKLWSLIHELFVCQDLQQTCVLLCTSILSKITSVLLELVLLICQIHLVFSYCDTSNKIATSSCSNSFVSSFISVHINTSWPRQNGSHFADDIFKHIFLNENVWISIDFSLKFISRGPIDNI